MMEAIELPNQGKIRTHGENETHKHLGIKKGKKSRENKKLFETKIYSRKFIK